MSGTLVYDLNYFQQVIVAYSGFLALEGYANPSGIILDALLSTPAILDSSLIGYNPSSGILFLDVPIELTPLEKSDTLSAQVSLRDSTLAGALDSPLSISGNISLGQNVTSGVFYNTVETVADTSTFTLQLTGQADAQEHVTPVISGNIGVFSDLFFASVDSKDSGVNDSDSVHLLSDLQDGSYQTIILDDISISGNLLFTSDIESATAFDIEILVDSGTGVLDTLLLDYSLVGQSDTILGGTSSLYEEVLEPPIELYFSDVISGVSNVASAQLYPIEQTVDNESLFGDTANGFSIFTTVISGIVLDVEKIDNTLDSYFNISLRFNIPLVSYVGFLKGREQPLESFALPVQRSEPRLPVLARFIKDEIVFRRKPWNPVTLPLEGKLLRLLSNPGEPLRLDVVQQYFVQPLGVTKKDGKFLLSDFPEGAIWEIDPFSGNTRDFVYRVGPPGGLVEHEGNIYFTSIINQGSIWVTNGNLTGLYLQDLGFFPSAIRSYRGRLYVIQPEIGRVWDITSPTNVFPVVTVPATLAYDFKFLGDKMYILDGVSSDRFLQSLGDDLNSVLYSFDLTTEQIRVEFFGSLKTPGNSSGGYSILAFEPVEDGFYYSDLGNTEITGVLSIWRPGCVGFLNYETRQKTLIVKAQTINSFNVTERRIEDFFPLIEEILDDGNLSDEERNTQLSNFVNNFNNNLRQPKLILPFQLYNDNGIIHIVDMGIGYSAAAEFDDSNNLGLPLNGNRSGGLGSGVDALLGGLGANLLRQLLSGGGGGGAIVLGETVNATFEPGNGVIQETNEDTSLEELLAQRYPWLGYDNVDVLLDIFSLSLFFKIGISEGNLSSFSDVKGLGIEDIEEEFPDSSGGQGEDEEGEPPAPIKIVDLIIDITNILYEFEEDEDPDLEADALPFPSFNLLLSFPGEGDSGFGFGEEVPDIKIPFGLGGDGEGGGINLRRDPGGLIVINEIFRVTDIIRFISPIIFLSRRKRRRNRPWNFTSSSAIDRTGKGVYMYQVPPFKKASIKSLKVCLFDNTLDVDRFFSVLIVPSNFFAPPSTDASIAEVREQFTDDLRSESPENLKFLIKNKRISPGETFALENLGILKDLERVYVISNEGLWMSFDMVFEEYPDFYSQQIIDFAEQAGIFNSEVLYTLDSNNSYRAG